jgi:hypothetical protein
MVTKKSEQGNRKRLNENISLYNETIMKILLGSMPSWIQECNDKI